MQRYNPSIAVYEFFRKKISWDNWDSSKLDYTKVKSKFYIYIYRYKEYFQHVADTKTNCPNCPTVSKFRLSTLILGFYRLHGWFADTFARPALQFHLADTPGEAEDGATRVVGVTVVLLIIWVI